MNHLEVSGVGPPTQPWEQFCEITAIESSEITKSIRICILCFLPTLRCIAKDTQLNYAKSLLKEQNLQKLSQDEVQFREFLMNWLEEKQTKSQEKSPQEVRHFSQHLSYLRESLMIQKQLRFSPISMILKTNTRVACGDQVF